MRQVAQVAVELAEGDLDKRMRVIGEDDVARLAESFNEMADSLKQQIQQLEEFGQLQRRFTSDVSHELRTPLTTVRMAADVLHASREEFPPGLSRSTELLVDELDRFEALLADLLEISRLDAGVAELSAEPISLPTIAQSAVDSVRGIAETSGVPLRVEVPGQDQDLDLVADARRVERIVRNLVAAAPDEPDLHLGLRAGACYHLTAYGILGFAFISSPTVRDGMAVALRYLELSFAFCIPRVRTGDDALRVDLDTSAIPVDVRDFLLGRDLAAIHTIMRELLTSPIPVRGLQLSAPAPVETAAYERLFGVVPEFGCDQDAVLLDPAFLDQPLPQANPHTLAMCEAQCRDLLTDRRGRTGYARKVREQLLAPDGVRMSMADVARRLHTTARTLHRRLHAEGT